MVRRSLASVAVPLLGTFLLITACGGSDGDAPATEPVLPPAPGSELWTRLSDPPIEDRPWVRWWWPGNDVEAGELRREIGLLVEEGYGGAEIQALDAGLDPGASPEEIARRRSFDTPSYYANLAVALEEARTRGLGIDLTLGSGWPVSGTHVPPERSVRTLLWGETEVAGPGPVELAVPPPGIPAFALIAVVSELFLGERLSRYEGDRAELQEVVAARVTGGFRSGNPLALDDTIELDRESVEVLTTRVEDGRLTWEVPEGTWRIVSVYSAPDGEYPVLPAQEPDGYVVDPLDAAEVDAILERYLGERTGLGEYLGDPLRAVFDDSLEFKPERHHALDLLEVFEERRGYDPRPWLPAILVQGHDNSALDAGGVVREPEFAFGDDDARVRHDYSRTVSDLFVERFLDRARSFGAERGVELRSQGYGLEVEVIRAQGAADIPETEQLFAGGSSLFLRTASAAAYLHDRPLVSAESLVFRGGDHMTTPAKLKRSADKLLTAGVNQLVYHAFPYRRLVPYGETGWHPFSSPFAGATTTAANLTETSPFFEDWRPVQRYVARGQVAMRQGVPSYDLLVHYPWLGFPGSLEFRDDHAESLFRGRIEGLEPPPDAFPLVDIGDALGLVGPDPRAGWLIELADVLDDLASRGFTWTWIDDAGLADLESDGRTIVRGREARSVVLFRAPSLEPAAARALADHAAAGGAVLAIGALPTRQAGLGERGDREVRRAMDRVREGARTVLRSEGSGALGALASIGVTPTVAVAPAAPLRVASRRAAGGFAVHLVANEDRAAIVAELRADDCDDPVLHDPWSDEVVAVGSGSIPLRLGAWGSRILVCGAAPPPATVPREVHEEVPLARAPPMDAGGDRGRRGRGRGHAGAGRAPRLARDPRAAVRVERGALHDRGRRPRSRPRRARGPRSRLGPGSGGRRAQRSLARAAPGPALLRRRDRPPARGAGPDRGAGRAPAPEPAPGPRPRGGSRLRPVRGAGGDGRGDGPAGSGPAARAQRQPMITSTVPKTAKRTASQARGTSGWRCVHHGSPPPGKEPRKVAIPPTNRA